MKAAFEIPELSELRREVKDLRAQFNALNAQLQRLHPEVNKKTVPDFISTEEAVKKYNVSDRTIRNKKALFKERFGRKIDTLGNQMNEAELQQALRLEKPFKRFT